MALAVRLRNGLLGEAFLGIRRHLAAVAAAAPSPAAAVQEQAQAAEVLVGQLLQHTALSRPSAVHAAVRMPFGATEEQVRGGRRGRRFGGPDPLAWRHELLVAASPFDSTRKCPSCKPIPRPPAPTRALLQAAVSWLEAQAAGGTAEAALMLPIYYLLRGRTPEALHAYARHCPRTPATQQQQDLAALLTEAARLLPAPQRALIVQQGTVPALLPSEGGDGEEAAGVALVGGAIPDVAAEGAAARPLVAVGPSAAQAPLVGSIPVLLEHQRLAAAAAQAATASDGEAAAAGGAGGAAAAQKSAAQQPMLFSAATDGAAGGKAAAAPTPGGFGAVAGAAAAPTADVTMLPAAGAHEFDRVLGLAPAAAGGGRSKRRWGGSAYR